MDDIRFLANFIITYAWDLASLFLFYLVGLSYSIHLNCLHLLFNVGLVFATNDRRL